MATKTVTGSISRILSRTDVKTLEQHEARQLGLNEIGRCEVALSALAAFDSYKLCKGTGSFILIDRLTNVTVGAGMIVGKAEKGDMARKVTTDERAARFNQKPITVWLTGDRLLDTAYRLDRSLFDLGYASAVLDDDSLGDQAGLVSRQLNEAGLICICALENVQPDAGEGSLILNAHNLVVEDVVKLLHSYTQPKSDQHGLDFEI